LKLKAHVNPVTPAALVLAAFPLIFALAPDGIPFVWAGCGGPATGTVTGLEIQICESCVELGGSGEEIHVTSCSLYKSASTCQIKATMYITITGNCDALWRTFCQNGGICDSGTAAYGPVSDQYFEKTLDCTGINTSENEEMIIEVYGAQECDCRNTIGNRVVYRGHGFCDL